MLTQLVEKYRDTFAPVIECNLTRQTVMQLDLSVGNQELYDIDLLRIDKLDAYIKQKLLATEKQFAIGGYGENRLIYQKSNHFGKGETARTIHLGIDIWCPANTSVYAPLEGRIHSFQNNDNFGDYGPTIILEHRIESVLFYTLYGHLSLASLDKITEGQPIKKGQEIATLGNEKENGHWPPHLHFQVIADMLGNKGDFPGVAAQNEKEKWLKICPDPEVFLIR